MRFTFFILSLMLVSSLNAAELTTPVHFVLVGDSTVTDDAGWGKGFKSLITDKATCDNTAAGGRSSKSFIAEGRLKKALALKGTIYLIQFGHNDQPGKGPERETDPATTFRENLATYIKEVQAIGGTPVLVTSLVRREFEKVKDGVLQSNLLPYAEAAKAVAAEKHVAVIDLHSSSKALVEKWGAKKCEPISPLTDKGKVDLTHLNAEGSTVFAKLVVEDLIKAMPELKPCFKEFSLDEK